MTKREPNARGEGDLLRAQLVAAAGELLMSPQQVALPSLRAVARACSVSPAAVYLHFESQQHLIQAVLDAEVEKLGAHLEESVAPGGEPKVQVAAFARAYACWGLAHPGAYQLLFESADRLDVPDHGEGDPGMALIARAGELIALALGTDAATGRRLSFQFWAQLHGIVSLRLHKPQPERPTSVEVDVADAVDLLMTRSALPTANRPV